MKEHEWEEYREDMTSLGHFYYYVCKNCGGAIVDLFYKTGNKPRRIKILGSNTGRIGSTVYLPDDCEKSQKMVQEYWERETKKKGLYKQKMRMYSK